MNEQPFVSVKSRDYFKVFVVVCVVILAATTAWLAYQLQTVADKQAALDAAVKDNEDTAADDPNNSGWNTVVASGKNGFQVTLPDGWGPVVNDTESDYLVMPGMAQPTLAKGSKVVVTEAKGHGSDSASLFSMVLLAKGEAAPPQGTAEEFAVGKSDDILEGTKYTYIYPKDDLFGIGIQRFQGDRDYEYILPIGDKELHIYYSVYGSDPRNLAVTVDEIVRTVTVPQQ